MKNRPSVGGGCGFRAVIGRFESRGLNTALPLVTLQVKQQTWSSGPYTELVDPGQLISGTKRGKQRDH